MIDYIKSINDLDVKFPSKTKKLITALNKFFNQYPLLVDGCLIRSNWDDVDIALIIESSTLYHYLQGEYGWEMHTKFYNSFDNTGYHPDPINDCVIGFYKD